jgi:hypothetical protein
MARKKPRRPSDRAGSEPPGSVATSGSGTGSACRHKADHAPAGFGNRRSWILAVLAFVFLILFYSLPANHAWLTRVVRYYRQIPKQARMMDPHGRQVAHLGWNYIILNAIDERLDEDDIFLLPPAAYVRRNFDPTHWHWAEPEYFYYFLGRQKTVTLESEDRRNATTTVLLRPRLQYRFVDLRMPGAYESALRAFEDSRP